MLRLGSRAPKLRDIDIPHRSKITKTAYELYLTEKNRIDQELQVIECFISVL
jgi:hypothetical protein